MKKLRFLLSIAVISFACINADAYDWVPKTNEGLFNDMTAYAESFADSTDGTRVSRILKRFIRRERRRFSKDEFAWISDTYELGKKLERLCPPVVDDGSAAALTRRHILRLIEYPMHVHSHADKLSTTPPGNQAPSPEQRKAFESARDSYMSGACREAMEWLKRAAPKSGELAIFRVYNMGYIFRTENRCFAIDLGRPMSEEFCNFAASRLDAIFVTHPHGDHYCDFLLKAMAEAGKCVFLPKDVIPGCDSGNKTVSWRDIVDEPLDVNGIKVWTLAGNQKMTNPSSMPNNVYHIEFDGWAVNHSGDNKDRSREARLGEFRCPDVAISASWNQVKITMDAIKTCRDYERSKVTFLPSHENEFWHRVMQRESWWEDFTRLDRYADPSYEYLPCIFLDNGESVLLHKKTGTE